MTASSNTKSTNVFADLSAPQDNPNFLKSLNLFEGKERDLVRDVLWKLNAPANLGMIGTIGERLERILLQSDRLKRAFSDKSSGEKVKQPTFSFLKQVQKFCNLLRVNKSLIEELLGDHAFSEPESVKINPLRGKSLRRHGLYAALLNAPEFDLDHDNWDLIALRLLLANSKAMGKWGQTKYEAYGGDNVNEEAKAMPVKLYSATRSLRQLTTENFKYIAGNLTEQEIVGSGLIRGFGKGETVEQWLLSREKELDLEELEPRHIKVFDPLSQVLAFCYKSENESFRTGGGGSRRSKSVAKDGSKHYWGPEHVLIDKQNQIISVDIDPDDIFEIEEPIGQFFSHESWDGKDNLPFASATPLTADESKKLDLSDEEIGDPGMVTGVGGQPTNRSGKKLQRYAALGMQRALAMDAQHLSWQKDVLTFAQVELLQRKIKGRVEELFEQRKRYFKNDFLEELQSNLLILTMLWTGSRIEKAITLQRILAKEQPKYKEHSLGYLVHKSSREGSIEGEWWFEAIQPPYQQQISRKHSNVRVRNRGSYFPDIFNISSLLEEYASDVKGWKDTPGSTREVFDITIEDGKMRVKKILKEIEMEDFLAQGMTLRRIEKFLFQYLAAQLGDVTAASIMVGEAHNLARVKLFYTTHDQDFLRNKYQQAISPLYKGLTGKVPLQPKPLTKAQSSGARACTTKDAYKAAVAEIQEEVVILNTKVKEGGGPSFWKFHNKYTTYIFLMFAVSTGVRAIRSPDIRASIYDSHGFSTLADKDTVPSYHARISWLPNFVREQIDVFETYCQRTAELVKGKEPSESPENSCFYLGPNHETIEMRPKTILPKLPKWLRSRVNGHRRFLRTELIEAGMNVESVDCFMGHWFAGEEPWADKASMNMNLHIQQLETYLVPILRDLGFDTDLSLALPVS